MCEVFFWGITSSWFSVPHAFFPTRETKLASPDRREYWRQLPRQHFSSQLQVPPSRMIADGEGWEKLRLPVSQNWTTEFYFFFFLSNFEGISSHNSISAIQKNPETISGWQYVRVYIFSLYLLNFRNFMSASRVAVISPLAVCAL